MLVDRHLRTLLFGAALGGSFLLLEELTWAAPVDLVMLRDWVVGGAFAAAILLAPDARRRKRSALLMVLAATIVYLGGLPTASAAVVCAGALVAGRIGGRRRLFDVALGAGGLLLASAIVAQTTVTEALALWSFFLIQSLHPVLVEGDLIAANEPPKDTTATDDAFTQARDEILSVLEA